MRLSRNDTVLVLCLGVATGMVGLSYAAVPLYYAFCRATGYGGTTNRADKAPEHQGTRVFTVRMDTNVSSSLNWRFEPVQRSVQVRVGENRLVFFRAENQDKVPVVGRAVFNVTPDNAARYFTKIECFCFQEQRLEAGESVEMPVSFFIDPAIVDDRDDDGVSDVTLSYTFYPSTIAAAAPASKAPRGS